MEPIQKAITGSEDQGGLTSAFQVLVQFYCAFNKRDIVMMEQNWANNNEIAMDNPLGGIKRGWNEIRSVYERIFNGSADVYVEYYDYTIHQTPEIFYAVGRERGYLRLDGKELKLAIRTSRIFQKIDGKWRQVHHHGSIEDPQLLAAYQGAVAGGKSVT
ncbi:MAG: nuclear transport factor 2 family protein [Deltaproteobacteria bacterium]|nr:nuclear transport factor 2 family protein [Deltaproteobacteria bacterium]